MTINKKKAFPKLKKSLKNFLTDESGKITKKDALGISAGAALFSGISEVDAASTYTQNISPTAGFYPSNSDAYQPANHLNTVENTFAVIDSATCSHASGIVNGHFSSTPSVSTSATTYTASTTHGSHGSHGSHGQW